MAKEEKDVKEEKPGTEVEVKSSEVTEPEAQPSTSMRPWDPWHFDREFERTLERFFDRGWPRRAGWDFPELKAFAGEQMPKVNVIDREDELAIEAELPGVDKDDIDVSMGDNSITIKATTKKETTEEKGDYHRREISSGTYVRTLPLMTAVDRDKAKAEFKDGMLTLTLPKTADSKRKSIKVE